MHQDLTSGQLALLRQLLEICKHELDHRIARRLGDAGRAEQAHEALQQDGDDLPQRDADREIDLARADRELEELGAVSEALARIQDPAYGRCIDCAGAIPFDRLKLEPWALRCVDCEAVRERSRGVVTQRSTI